MTNPQRYALMEGEMVPASNGQWVEWDDHEYAMEQLKQEMDALEDDYRELHSRFC